MKPKPLFAPTDFRAELQKMMPGYKWTVHKQDKWFPHILAATGIKTSGFNRLSTLVVERKQEGPKVEYKAMSSGFGTRAPWAFTSREATLARSLRVMQEHYERQQSYYGGLAAALRNGRKP